VTPDPPSPSILSISVPRDLPPIPGPSRATYKVERSRSKRFGKRRSSPYTSPASSSRNTYKAHGRGGGTRRWPKRLLIAVTVLIPVVLVAAGGGYLYVNSRLDSIVRVSVPALTAEKSGQPIDILLIGSDSRACVTTAAQAKAFGSSASQTGQRSDVIIVVRLISSTDEVEMLSIPRDTWVPIAGTSSSNKINAAFNNGPNQLVETIQDDFHIPINHVMMTNFCGFSAMVNAVGGISLNFPDPVRDQYSGLNIKTTGCQVVDGAQALGLVRSRHLYYYKDHTWTYDGDSDWSRIRRQQAFFHALLDRVHGVFPNIFELNSFLGATVSDLTVDSGLSSGQMLSIGLHFHSLGESNLMTSVLPTSPETIDGQDALIAPEPYATQAIDRFLALGTPAKPGHGSTSSASSTTAPSSTAPPGVVTDTPQSLPEPWNPTPC
jgi:LCP family protein required for cell wall assembly